MATYKSNDIFDTAQVAVFVRAIHDNLDVIEELLGHEYTFNYLIKRSSEPLKIMERRTILNGENCSVWENVEFRKCHGSCCSLCHQNPHQCSEPARFKQFLSDMNEECGDLLLHCEVRCFSNGKVLSRFWALSNSIYLFPSETDELQTEREYILNDDWLNNLAFMVEITSYLDCLSERLQGKGKLFTNFV
ncbi:hypothetical protein RF11_06607 [Thelohanellus kitauei]|uniref:Uncharacterized protein n=1 Tax=Thelohanellus kitauei TaxID=669202 RepID=A0A0C2IHA1_THEKT|nr:hypothetical protein RF11_06607 [Thelohanellus kitauei]